MATASATHHQMDAHTTFHNENLKFAVWLYLASEVVIFSILIAGYAIFRVNEPAAVTIVKENLGIALVSANTFILLASSYAMVMGLRAIEAGNRKGLVQWIGITAIMGTAFLGGQYIEYSELAHLGVALNKYEFSVETTVYEQISEVEADILREDGVLLTGVDLREATFLAPDAEVPATEHREIIRGTAESYAVHFENNTVLAKLDLTQFEATNAAGEEITYNDIVIPTLNTGEVYLSEILAGSTAVELAPEAYADFNGYFRTVAGDVSDFGMRFYAPTAFHGAHVFVGVLWAFMVMWRGQRGRYDNNSIGVELFGLYWHFVDVVWIVLFTLIYLV